MRFSKILSLLLAIAMLISIPTYAQSQSYSDVNTDDTYYEAVEALSSLGIIKGYEEGNFQPNGKITRAEFATIIMRVLGMSFSENVRKDTIFEDVTSSHWASGSIDDAYNSGIVNGVSLNKDSDGNIIGGIFDPESEVTYEQAIKMIVCALGYQKKAEASVAKGVNPYPTGYNMIANQKKITEGTTTTSTGASRATVARLVYNALTVNLMDQTSFGTTESFSEIPTQSLLYTKLDAIKVDAKITKIDLDPSSTKVSLSMIDSGYDDVALANNRYNTKSCLSNIDKGDVDLTGLQGLSVTAIVDISDTGDEKLLAAFPKSGKNYELSIAPELFQDINDKSIRYYKDKDSSTLNTSSKVKAPFNIYLNLVNVETVDSDSLISSAVSKYAVQNGYGGISTNDVNYRFTDTDDDGYYDALFVENAASFVVGKINYDDKEIYRSTLSSVMNSSNAWNSVGTYDFSPLELDDSDDDVSYTIRNSKGNIIDIDDIDVGDVLTVYMSEEDNYRYYDIVVSTARAISGTISETKEVKLKGSTDYVTYYVIEGDEYRLNRDASSSKMEAGMTGEFMLTADNKIISFDLDATVRNFAAAINIAKNTGAFDSNVKVQLFNRNGSVATYSLASTYYLNGVAATVNDSTAATVATDLKTAIAGKVIIYELNSKNEIKKLYYGQTGLKLVDDDYRIVDNTASAVEYKYGSSKLGSTYLTDDTTIVTVKDETKTTDKDQYSLIGERALNDEEAYKCYIVTDSTKEAQFVLISGFQTTPSFDSKPFVVTGISTTSVDGSIRKKFTGYMDNKEVSYVMADDEDVTFVDMSGKVNGSAFTTYSVSSSFATYSLALEAKTTADAAVETALTAKTAADSLFTDAKETAESAQNELSIAQKNLNSAKETLTQIQNDEIAKQTALQEAQSNKEAAQNSYNLAQAAKDSSDEELEKALTAKNNADEAYQAATASLKNANDALVAANKTLETAKDKLAIAQNSQSTTTQKIAETTALMPNIKGDEQSMTDALKLATSNVETLTTLYNAKASATESALKLQTNAQAVVTDAQKAKDTADAAYKTAKTTLDTLTANKASDAELTVAKANAAKCEKDATDAAVALKKAQDNLTDAQKNYATAASELKTAKDNLESAKTALQVATANLADVKKASEINNLLAQLNIQLASFKADEATANSEIAVANESIKAANDAITKAQTVLDDTKNAFDLASSTYDTIKTNNETTIVAFDQAKSTLNNADLALSSVNLESVMSLEDAQAAVTTAEEKYNDLAAVYDEANQKLTVVQTAAEEAQSAYDSALTKQTSAAGTLASLTSVSNSASLSVASSINTNDVLQLVLNANDEIISYRHLVKNYNGYMYAMVATANYEDSDTDISANLVAYPLSSSSLPDILDDRETFNGIVVKKDLTMKGFGIGGRVYSSSGRSIEFFDPSATATTYAAAIENTRDTTYNQNNFAYYIGNTYSKVKVSTLDSLKSYNTVSSGNSETEIEKSINKTDDIVYIYKYDGDSYLTLVIDTLSDNIK